MAINKQVITDEEAAAKEQLSKQIREYLDKGGTVTVCQPGAHTENLQVGQWGRRKAKPKPPPKPE